jgi:2-C-methyl-D-erythritol 4-phosphate cytidylyltransferase
MPNSQKADAIIVAAGTGTRFGEAKQFALLEGKPLYQHSLRTFALLPEIKRIILVVHADHIREIDQHIQPLFYGRKIEVALGGETRQDSVSNGMQKLEELGNPSIVLVHDAARPFISDRLITNVITGVIEFGAALAAIPVVDTLKQSQEGFAIATVGKENLWRAQTPQGARFTLLKKALENAHNDNYSATDEAELLERIGVKPVLILGDEKNVKITYEHDLKN